jgi:aminoglycoside phosphotransferase (APT) family kinase protein
LRRWQGQFIQSRVDDKGGPVIIDQLHDVLVTQIPLQQGVAIVHGDYRMSNVVIGSDGSIRAVLDWEISTLGDPLADLGLLLVYWSEVEDDETSVIGNGVTRLPGFANRKEIEARYASRSDRDLSALPYYKAFGLWKLACILQGVYARYAGGAAGGDRSSVDTLPVQIRQLGEQALVELESM